MTALMTRDVTDLAALPDQLRLAAATGGMAMQMDAKLAIHLARVLDDGADALDEVRELRAMLATQADLIQGHAIFKAAADAAMAKAEARLKERDRVEQTPFLNGLIVGATGPALLFGLLALIAKGFGQ